MQWDTQNDTQNATEDWSDSPNQYDTAPESQGMNASQPAPLPVQAAQPLAQPTQLVPEPRHPVEHVDGVDERKPTSAREEEGEQQQEGRARAEGGRASGAPAVTQRQKEKQALFSSVYDFSGLGGASEPEAAEGTAKGESRRADGIKNPLPMIASHPKSSAAVAAASSAAQGPTTERAGAVAAVQREEDDDDDESMPEQSEHLSPLRPRQLVCPRPAVARFNKTQFGCSPQPRLAFPGLCAAGGVRCRRSRCRRRRSQRNRVRTTTPRGRRRDPSAHASTTGCTRRTRPDWCPRPISARRPDGRTWRSTCCR